MDLAVLRGRRKKGSATARYQNKDALAKIQRSEEKIVSAAEKIYFVRPNNEQGYICLGLAVTKYWALPFI